MPTTNYIWDEENILAETDGSNVVQTVYTNEPQQYGNLVSTRLPVAGTPTTVYHHFDAIGSTRQLTNAAGSTTDTMIYDAWGNVVNRTGATDAMLRWVGEIGYYFDRENGLVSVRERIYGPAVARWITADPSGFADGLNRYAYVVNQVLQLVDPSGRFCVPTKCNGGTFVLQSTPCDTYENGDFFSIGKEFRVTVVITKPDCECCWYKQYVKGRQLLRLISRATREGNDEVNDVTEWHEDCLERADPNNPKTTFQYCRGRRTSRFLGPGKAEDFPATDAYCPDRKSGCLYRSWDLPAINIKMEQAEEWAKEYIVEGRIELRYRIALVDKCAKPESEMILGEFNITCSAKLDVRAPLGIHLAPEQPCPITLSGEPINDWRKFPRLLKGAN